MMKVKLKEIFFLFLGCFVDKEDLKIHRYWTSDGVFNLVGVGVLFTVTCLFTLYCILNDSPSIK